MPNARWTAALAALALALTACAGTDDTDGDPVAAEEPTEEVALEEGDAGSDDAAAVDEDATEDDTMDEGAMDHGAMDDGAMEEEAADDEVAAEGDDVDRVVAIDMGDMFFSEDELEFTVGERVRFDFRNVGQAPHEALIGDMHLQEEHEEDMASGEMGHDDGHGEGHHDDVSVISLESGESGSLVHHFTEAGEFWMGCHVPGHWPAGMRARITVTQ